MKAGLVSKRNREDVRPQHLNQKQNLMVTQSYLNHLGFCNQCSSITFSVRKNTCRSSLKHGPQSRLNWIYAVIIANYRNKL